jgi:hypothetical protein
MNCFILTVGKILIFHTHTHTHALSISLSTMITLYILVSYYNTKKRENGRRKKQLPHFIHSYAKLKFSNFQIFKSSNFKNLTIPIYQVQYLQYQCIYLTSAPHPRSSSSSSSSTFTSLTYLRYQPIHPPQNACMYQKHPLPHMT